MRNRMFFVLLAIAILVLCDSVYAQNPQSQFGYVNVADAMLLHPMMRHFDPISKRFKLEALKGVDPEKRAEENKINFKEELKKLENNVKELEEQRNEISEKYYAEIEKIFISEEKLKNMSVPQKNKYNEKKTKIDNKYHNDIDELRKKIYYAKQKVESFKNSSIYTGLSTQGETNQLFSLMLDDVYDAMGAVAKHYKVAFVFNSSSELSFREGRMTASNPMGDFLDNFEQSVQDRDGKKIMGAAFTSWLQEKNSTFLNCNDRRMTSFVMMGGLNMTPAVIDYIYQKHKVGKEQRDFIIEYFEKIVNNDEN